MLRALQGLLGVAYILISHDLRLVAEMADEIAVMEHGAIVEHGAAGDLMSQPRHPRTRELIAASRVLEGWGDEAGLREMDKSRLKGGCRLDCLPHWTEGQSGT